MSPSPRVFAPPCPASPFASPFAPLPPSPLSPWYNPFPPLSPYSSFPYHYGYAPSLPYGYPPLLPPDVRPREKEQQRIDQTLIKEILTTAFASRALASQEERSGFLFFLLPLPHIGTTMLTWDWYDCDTQALVAHLIAPIAVERHT